MSEFIIGSGDLWAPFLSLLRVIETSIATPTDHNVKLLEAAIKRHRQDFRGVLATQGKNPADREELKKAVHDPISLRGHAGKKRLPQQMVHEALLISDMFDINELHAMDLLVTGEAEMGNHPGWTRGLVAVYIYFEGRNSMIAAFNNVMVICPGNTWGSHASPRIIDICNTLLEQVLQDDFMDKVLRLLDKYDLSKQMEALDTNLALGDWRHRTRIVALCNSIREGLARIIFYWSAQRTLCWPDTFRLLEYLRTNIRLTEDFKMTKEYLFLIVAVLFAIDNNLSGPDSNRNYSIQLRKYYTECEESTKFQCPELLEMIKLAYFEIIYKASAERSINTMQGNTLPTLQNGQTVTSEEDLELKTDVFGFMKNEIFRDPKLLRGEEHVMRQFHRLLVSFINYMPTKLKDMKNKSEDAVKTAIIYDEQGITKPTNLPRDYENFLESLGSFYAGDDSLELAADYFRSGADFMTLCKLVRCACLDSPAMFAPNVKMFTGFAASYTAGVFALLKQNGHNLSLEHFFDSINKYLTSVGCHGPLTAGPSVYASETFHRVVLDPIRLNPSEVHGICTYLELLKGVCSTDANRNYFIYSKRLWLVLCVTAGRARALPLEIRSRMLDVSAAMIPKGVISVENINMIWDILYFSHLVQTGNGDLRDELEEKETRLESYGLTISFLRFLSAVVAARFGWAAESPDENTCVELGPLDAQYLEPYVSYVKDSVLIKLIYRSYVNMSERWEKAELALNILSNLLDVWPHLMIQMLSESPLLKTVLLFLVDCARVRELSTGPIPHIDQCSYECLKLISRVYDRQSTYLYRRDRDSEQNWVLLGIHELLQKINGDTGRPEYLISLLKFTDTLNPERNRNLATHILAKIISNHRNTDANLYSAVTSDSTLSDIVRHSFTKCLSNDNSSEAVKKDIMAMLRASVIHSSPNFGFFLLGVDKVVEFENPGIRNYPRTLLHTILDHSATLSGAFQTLLVLIRDVRLRDPLLRYLRTNQFFVKFFLEEFPQPEMEVECMGYFFKCIAIELNSVQQPSSLANALVGDSNAKFINILNKIQIETEGSCIPNLEFFEQELIMEAMKRCEYKDQDLNINLVDTKMLGEIFDDEISKLEKSTALRLKKSVQGEAKELLAFARKQNETRKTEASKILLFDCWRQCLEIIVLAKGSLDLAGVDFVTTILRILTEKMKVPRELSSESFQRLAAETTMVLCAVLAVFGDNMNNTMLNKVLQDLCHVTADEQSSSVRAIMHSCILYVLRIMKDREGAGNTSDNLSIIIESLCKDSIHAKDVGRMQALYLLGEIIRSNVNRGLGGVTHLFPSEVPPKRSTHNISLDKSVSGLPSALGVSSFFQSVDLGGGGDFPEVLEHTTDLGIPRKKSISNSTPVNMNSSMTTKSHTRVLNQTQSLNSTGSVFGTSQSQLGSKSSILDTSQVTKVKSPANTTISTRSALTDHLHTKGFLKSIIEELPLVDDENLLKLFSNKPGATHMRALLVFEAKMFMLSRFAKTGPAAARILLNCNLVLSLADMKVFEASTYPEVHDPMSLPNLDIELGFSNMDFGELHLPNVNRMDTLFVSLFTLLLSMESSSRKNLGFYEQVWHFFETHDQSLAILLEYPENHQHLIGEDVLLLLTTLLARTSQKFPMSAMMKKMRMWNKLAAILRTHADYNGPSELQIQIVKNILVFFHGFSTNVNVRRRENTAGNPNPRCVQVLEYKVDPGFAMTKADELTAGVVLKIVQDAAHRISHTDDLSDQSMRDLIRIMEVGLTIVYLHMDRALREIFDDISSYQSVQQRFQFDLALFMEEAFVKTVKETSLAIQDYTYIQTILARLRRLAHLQKY